KRIGEYIDECRKLGDVRFAERYSHAVLLRREDDVGEEPDASFHTAFMRRDLLGDLGRPNPGPETMRAPELRPSDRPKVHPVGEILPVTKRQGAPFQER